MAGMARAVYLQACATHCQCLQSCMGEDNSDDEDEDDAEQTFKYLLSYSRLCPSTAGSSPPSESSNILFFVILVHTATCLM